MNKSKSKFRALVQKATGFVRSVLGADQSAEVDHSAADPGYPTSRLCPTVALDRVSAHPDRDRIIRRMR
jgi:hypothetical protein